jgi:hypothetical protein
MWGSLGILLGALYGFAVRLWFGSIKSDDSSILESIYYPTDLYSLTFIWVVPMVIGTIPMLFATERQIRSINYRIFAPLGSVGLFFVFCFSTRVEDVLCILILLAPFLFVAGLAGLLLGAWIHYRRIKKQIKSQDFRDSVFGIILLPFITSVLEPNLPTATETYEVRSSILIDQTPAQIWKNIVRVAPIKENEYPKGFFYYAGVPRPLYATLSKDTLGGLRKGYFEGGLMFQETVMDWKPEQKIELSVKIVPSAMGNGIFERHILASQRFNFVKAAYLLEKDTETGKTKLTLLTQYELSSNLNFYGAFWGNWLLDDFQSRLLRVIKKRCEK